MCLKWHPTNTHTYVYEIVLYIFPHVLDGSHGTHTPYMHQHYIPMHLGQCPTNTHTYVYEIVLYIPMCLGWLCKHARTHMYIIYKIMLVCCRVPYEMNGKTHMYIIYKIMLV